MYLQFRKSFYDAIRCLQVSPGKITLPTAIPCEDSAGTWSIAPHILDTDNLILKALGNDKILVEISDTKWVMTSVRFSAKEEQTALEDEVGKILRYLEREDKKLTFSQAAELAQLLFEDEELEGERGEPGFIGTADGGLYYFELDPEVPDEVCLLDDKSFALKLRQEASQ